MYRTYGSPNPLAVSRRERKNGPQPKAPKPVKTVVKPKCIRKSYAPMVEKLLVMTEEELNGWQPKKNSKLL